MIESKIVSKLNSELQKLENFSGVIGFLVIDMNGLTITSFLPRNIDEKSVGALSASIFEAMEAASSEISDEIINVTVEYDDIQLIMLKINENALLGVFTELNIDFGLLMIELEELIENINNIIGGNENSN
ncbi:MAG: roadblock/LC7 domain-containing protein [Promethearchaeota archaeon]